MTDEIQLKKYRCLPVKKSSIICWIWNQYVKKIKEISQVLIASEWLMQSGWKTIGVFLLWYQACLLNMKPICEELFELLRHIKCVDRQVDGRTDWQTEKVITIWLLHFQCRTLIRSLIYKFQIQNTNGNKDNLIQSYCHGYK